MTLLRFNLVKNSCQNGVVHISIQQIDWCTFEEIYFASKARWRCASKVHPHWTLSSDASHGPPTLRTSLPGAIILLLEFSFPYVRSFVRPHLLHASRIHAYMHQGQILMIIEKRDLDKQRLRG